MRLSHAQLVVGALQATVDVPPGAVEGEDLRGHTGASNGPTEGLNLPVKRIKRCGHGFQRFENYRLRALLHAGGVAWPADRNRLASESVLPTSTCRSTNAATASSGSSTTGCACSSTPAVPLGESPPTASHQNALSHSVAVRAPIPVDRYRSGTRSMCGDRGQLVRAVQRQWDGSSLMMTNPDRA